MKKLMLFIIPAFLFVSIFKAQSAVATQEELAESVKLAPCQMKDRLEAVKKLFVSVGAKESEIKIEKFKDVSNVVVRKKGKSAETIVIGAHYDKTDAGCGAIDNWTGVSIIAHIYKSLSNLDTQKSYIFVAFDQEEKYMLGSEAMVKAIPKDSRKNYCAMVNIDSFGISHPQAMFGVSSSKMTKFAKNVAKESNYQFSELRLVNASTDSASFLNKGIPAITFIGLDSNWKNYLHTEEDKLKNIKMESVYTGYKFILDFVTKVDAEPCQVFR